MYYALLLYAGNIYKTVVHENVYFSIMFVLHVSPACFMYASHCDSQCPACFMYASHCDSQLTSDWLTGVA